MQARRVTVVHDGDVLGELADEPDLLLCEGSAARGHHVGDAHLVHHDHVHVTLDQDTAVLPGDFALGKVDAQQVAALDVNLGFGRVHILGRVVGLEGAAAVGDDAPAHRVDGEHHPFAELVHQFSVLLLDGQTGGYQVFVLVTGGTGGVNQGGFARRGPAQAPLLDGGVQDVPLAVILVTHGAAFAFLKLVAEELAGELTHGQQALAALPGGNLFGRLFLFLDLDIVFLGQISQGFGVGHMLILHHKAHGAAGLAAAEALVDSPGRRHMERRRLFVVEGAAGYETGSAALERHEVSHHLFDAGGVQDLVYCLLGNHK